MKKSQEADSTLLQEIKELKVRVYDLEKENKETKETLKKANDSIGMISSILNIKNEDFRQLIIKDLGAREIKDEIAAIVTKSILKCLQNQGDQPESTTYTKIFTL